MEDLGYLHNKNCIIIVE